MTDAPSARKRVRWILAALVLGGGLAVVASRDSVEVREPPTPLGALPTSLATVPVAYSAGALTDALELRVPLVSGDLELRRSYPSDPRFQYAFEAKRAPFQLQLRGDTVHLSTVVQYAGQLWFQTPFGVELTASCGVANDHAANDAPRALVAFSSPIGADPDWNLRSAVRVDRLEPVGPDDRCIVSVFQFQMDATDTILGEIRAWLDAEAEQMNLALRDTSLRPLAEEAWRRFQEPIEITDDAWLTLNPVAVGYRASAGSTNHEILGQLDLAMRPTFVVGDRPSISPSALPPLEPMSPGEDPGLAAEGRFDYRSISEMATRALAGQTFLVLERSVTLQSIAVSGTADGKIIANLEAEGDLPGRITLSGTPVLDTDTGEVDFPDLAVSIEAEDMRAQAAAWLFRVGFIRSARRQARIPLGEILAEQLRLLAPWAMPLSERATLEARLGDVQITDLRATISHLVVRWHLRPDAVLRLR